MVSSLSVAVCLFPNVTVLDYQGTVELLGFATEENTTRLPFPMPSFIFHFTYVSHTLEPIHPVSGPAILPQATYKDLLTEKKQFDIIFVPGGPGHLSRNISNDVLDFIKTQSKEAKYVLSVCTGSWILADCGLLDNKRATTNKFSFKTVKETTSEKIQWVAKARWVVDGKFWTSSGVTAGADMANAFLIHLNGEDFSKAVRGVVELSAKGEDEDEFAEFYNLI